MRLALFVLLATISVEVLAQNPSPAPDQAISRTYYSGAEQKLTLRYSKADARGFWKISSNGRTLVSGDARTDASGDATISFMLPELKPGVVVDAELTWGVEKSEHTQALRFHSPNPFKEKRKVISDAGVGVWCQDPEASKLRKLFTRLDVPFAAAEAMASFTGAVLLVEGMDFDESPGMFATIRDLCGKGAQVIVVPPVKGGMSFDSATCSRILLAGNNQITSFDKKLDPALWGGKPLEALKMKWQTSDGTDCLRITGGLDSSAAGFTYCEMEIGKGHLIFCGWDLAGGSDISPTPLALLKVLIDQALNTQKE